MQPRLNYGTVAPGAMKSMTNIEEYIASTDIDKDLANLIKIRVSQINGCAWCLDMHTKDSKASGIDEQKILLVPVWYDAPVFNDKEKTAFEWAESLTRNPAGRLEVSDNLYKRMRDNFSEKQIVDLTMVVIAINGWNRLNIAFHNVVCNYIPDKK